MMAAGWAVEILRVGILQKTALPPVENLGSKVLLPENSVEK